MKKSTLIIGIIVFVFLCFLAYTFVKPVKVLTDAEKFSKEYNELAEDNVFVYKSASEIINMLQNGTGIVYLGFPSCPWCQRYVLYLNEVAKNEGIKTIYYYNIYDDRKNNTETYKNLVSILKNNLLNDEKNNSRIYVPNLTFVKNGNIIANDNETSVVEEGLTPDTYWTKEKVSSFKEKITNYITELNDGACDEGCN